ncbi:MAG: hypothetical protein QW728_06370, partial [Thermoplasmata archaeon]
MGKKKDSVSPADIHAAENKDETDEYDEPNLFSDEKISEGNGIEKENMQKEVKDTDTAIEDEKTNGEKGTDVGNG